MDNIMEKHTIETYAQKYNLSKQAALNKLTKLKQQGYVTVSGGGPQKRIYSLYKKPQEKTNGFYNLINKYSPEKLTPQFEHYVKGKYSIEHAIIDAIQIGDVRTLEAAQHLFRHVTNWKRLFTLAKKKNCEKQVKELYVKARQNTKVKKIPQRYEND